MGPRGVWDSLSSIDFTRCRHEPAGNGWSYGKGLRVSPCAGSGKASIGVNTTMGALRSGLAIGEVQVLLNPMSVLIVPTHLSVGGERGVSPAHRAVDREGRPPRHAAAPTRLRPPPPPRGRGRCGDTREKPVRACSNRSGSHRLPDLATVSEEVDD